jgi:hypothetical protein
MNKGTIMDYLDAVMVQADWSYAVSNGVIIIQDEGSKRFRLNTSGGVRNVETNINNLEVTAGDSETSSNSENKFTLDHDPLEDLTNALLAIGFTKGQDGGSGGGILAAPPIMPTQEMLDNGILGDLGNAAGIGGGTPTPSGSFAMLKGAGILFTHGTPNMLRKAEELVGWFNDGYSAKAVIEVALYELDRTNSVNRSLDLDILRESTNSLGISLSAPSSSGTTLTSAGLSFSVNDPDSKLLGSSAVGQWLTQQGKTSVKINRRIELVNNELATIEARRNNPYVANVTRSLQTTGDITNAVPEVELANQDTGFALHLMPSINVESGSIALRINMSRASFVRDFTYSFDDGSITGGRPIIDSKNDVITVDIRDGEAKIISSADLYSRSANKGATPYMPIVGDAVDNSETTADFVLYISAALVKS